MMPIQVRTVRKADAQDHFEDLERQATSGLGAYNLETDYGACLHKDYVAFVMEEQAPFAIATCAHKEDWFYVRYLWVGVEYRGRGYGARLMSAIESLARDKGCRGVHLVTTAYQAVAFYHKCGYQEFARLDGYAEGHARLYFKKEL